LSLIWQHTKGVSEGCFDVAPVAKVVVPSFPPHPAKVVVPLRRSQRLPDSPRKAIMNLGPKSLALSACLCLTSILSMAQGTPCTANGEAPAQGSPIACVTGDGVQVTAASTPAAAIETLPLTPEQRPAAAPLVTYIDGKLSVTAKNSTLGDILRAISAKTGASIDIPEGANERVVSQLGPAPARDVMTALLNGSHFNYVMVGTETNPNAIAHVILTAKTDRPEGSVGGAMAASATRGTVQPRTALQAAIMQPYQEMLEQQQAQQAALEAQQAGIAAAAIETLTPTASASEPAGTNTAGGSATSENGGAEATPSPNEAARGINTESDKTPHQVLQNLYEARRQMIQAQRQPPAPEAQQ